MQIADGENLIDRLCALPSETEWVEFKHNYFDAEQIAKTICALANSAMLAGVQHGFLVFGVHDKTHEIVGSALRTRK